jgi:hypothetical protein
MRRGSFFWGTVLVLVGGLLLLSNLGLLTISVWRILWPSLLILLGLRALIGPMIGRAASTETLAIPLGAATSGRVAIHHGAGILTVRGGAPAGQLVSGTFGGGVEHSENVSGGELAADLRLQADGHFHEPWAWREHELDWDLRLAEGIPLALSLETGAGKTTLDLTSVAVTDLSIQTGASSTDVLLPSSAGLTRVEARGGAASMSFKVPDGVAARIRGTAGLASITVDENRFPSRGGVWESDGYDEATDKVELNVEMGAGAVKVS